MTGMPHHPRRSSRPTTAPVVKPAPGTLARSFDAVAAQYAATRPGYPPALFDAIEELAGRPLAGARVLDVGAGTGIATGLLPARGAQVTAVEPGAAMAGELRAAGTPLVRARGEALPFRDDAGFDVVGYAQAWHWTDPARSVPEAMRVLRPVLEDERSVLQGIFPDGIVEEAYALDLTVTLRPSA